MGLWEAHKRFGKLPWSELLTPAIGYAQKGFKVADKQFQYRRDAVALFNGKTNFGDYFGHMKAGEAFLQPDLAKTLERIADKGPDEFYKGHTADLLVAQMQQDKGLITHQDLADYKVRWREPMRVDWQGNTLYTAPLPSSGGIALAQLLGIKENRAADFKGVELNSARQHPPAGGDRETRVRRPRRLPRRPGLLQGPGGAPDRSGIPEAACRRGQSDGDLADREGPSRPGAAPDHALSIVDADGNAVSNTYTLNWDFGSGVVVKGAGFLLNDEMDDFSAKPGVASAFGVVGSDANAIEPGKRMLSSMSPSIVTRDGKVSLVVGTPGGSRIFTSIFQVLNNIYDFHLPLEKAAGRAARAPPVAAQGHDLLRRLRAARRQGRRGAEGDGLHPGGPGLEHGRYPGHPRRRQGPGDRLRSPWPRRRPGGETLTGRRAADAARA